MSWGDDHVGLFLRELKLYGHFLRFFTCRLSDVCRSLAPLSKLSFPAIVALVAGFAVIIKLGLDM